MKTEKEIKAHEMAILKKGYACEVEGHLREAERCLGSAAVDEFKNFKSKIIRARQLIDEAEQFYHLMLINQ